MTYSQQILKEFGWIEKGVGRGIDTVNGAKPSADLDGQRGLRLSK